RIRPCANPGATILVNARRSARTPPTLRRCTLVAMPQVVDLPPIGQDARGALVALVRVCKETPAKESFRELRSRLRTAKLWERDRPAVMLRFLGVGGATITPSPFMLALGACTGEDDTAIA